MVSHARNVLQMTELKVALQVCGGGWRSRRGLE